MFDRNLLESSPVCFDRDDENDNLIFPLKLVGGLRGVLLGCRFRCLLCRGEWFLDLRVGIPYLPTPDGVIPESQALLGQQFNPVAARAAFLRELMTVPGVVEVPTLRVQFEGRTRNLTVAWTVQTQFADSTISSLLKRKI